MRLLALPPNLLVTRPPLRWVLALCYACSMLACASTQGAAALPLITSITLERDCFGCTSGTRLQLQGEGLATFTITGKARHGTVDQISQGPLTRADFEALSRLLEEQGFFALPERIEDPKLQDGAWTQISVAGPALEKQVFRRSASTPAGLQKIEAALDALKATLQLRTAAP